MRRFALFGILLLGMLTASCVDAPEANDNPLMEQGKDIALTVTATLPEAQATKTAIQADETSIYWSVGDAINLFYGATSGKFETSITEPAATAEFHGTLTVATGSTGTGLGAQSFWGVYPYNEANTSDGSSVTLSIPAVQSAAAGTFANNLNPSVATSQNLGLSFYNVGSWFIFSVTQEGVTSATFQGNNNEDVAGTVRVSMDTDNHPVAEVIDGVKSITINAPDGGTFETGKIYYMVVLPQTFERGYSLTLYKGDLLADCRVNKSATFGRSSFRRKRNADDGLVYVRTGNIVFADPLVKEICVSNWDTSGDGELSYKEAAAVTSLDGAFYQTDIESFNEFQYFTGLQTCGGFGSCQSLTTITLPPQVTSIGYSAFRGCSSLTAVTFSEDSQLTNIGNNAFYQCKALASITIPASVTTIEESAFMFSGLESVTVEEDSQLASLGEKAFYYCGSLETFSIQDDTPLTSIGAQAFRDCSSLTGFSIPSSVTTIGDYAFQRCSTLTDMTIPAGVMSIGRYAFDSCALLEEVSFLPGSQLNIINDYLFSDCSNLSSINIPSGVTTIYNYAFNGCSSLNAIEIPSSVTGIRDGAFNCCSGLTEVIIPNDSQLVYIGGRAFYQCGSLTGIHLPASMKAIDSEAFADCVSLEVVTIPFDADLTSIGQYAFSGCGNMTAFDIPSKVTDIGMYAFKACRSLTSIVIPNSMTTIKQQVFYNCSGLTSVTIPSSVTSIGFSTFYGCTSLPEITIPSSVTFIDFSAFFGCSGLESVVIPNSINSIEALTFANCFGLSSIEIPSSVTRIGNSAFACTNFTSIEIPEGVTSIGNEVFMGCTHLTSIFLPSSLESIGKSITSECRNLASLVVYATTPPSLESQLFYYNLIYVPDDCVDIYKAAAGWSSYARRIYPISLLNATTGIGHEGFHGDDSI